MKVNTRSIPLVVGVLLVAASCSATSSDENSSSSSTTATTTTSTKVTTTTTTAGTTTTEAPTTTTAEAGPILHVAGSSVIYTPTGEVLLQGWVEGPASVTIGGTDAETYANPGSRTDFRADLVMDVGTVDVEVVATAPDGASSSQTVTIMTDPSLIRQFAFISAVDPEASTLVADYAEWFTGDDAAAAAIADGEGDTDGTYDLDFYIRNQNDRLRTLEVAAGTEVVLVACFPNEDGPCVTTEAVGLVTFADLVADPESALDTQGWNWYGAGGAPYWLTLSDGVVIQIEEQYLP